MSEHYFKACDYLVSLFCEEPNLYFCPFLYL